MDRGKPPGGVRTILLVDNRDDCRVTTKWFLSHLGFAVDSVRSGEEALAAFNPRSHDLVLADDTMPGMSGLEMAHVIKLRSPATPVVMCAGVPLEMDPCVDLVLQRPAHLLTIKAALDNLLAKKFSS